MPPPSILVLPRRVNNSWPTVLTKAEVSASLFTPLSPSLFTPQQILHRASLTFDMAYLLVVVSHMITTNHDTVLLVSDLLVSDLLFSDLLVSDLLVSDLLVSDSPVLCILHVVREGVELYEEFDGVQVSFTARPV